MAESLARGEPNRERIGLTLFRDVVEETMYPASPSGIPARITEKLGEIVGGGSEDGSGQRG